MIIQHGLQSDRAGDGAAPVALTIGNFDGVHRGHRRLLKRLVRLAGRATAEPVVLTFDPHPRCVLDPDNCPSALTTLDEKCDLLAAAGVKRVVVLPFTRELSRWSAAHFCEQLTAHLRLRRLLVGPDFALGHRRQGDIGFLRAWGAEHGFTVETVAPVSTAGVPISSSRVRVALLDGRPGEANRLLGRPYFLDGRVEHGDRIGSRIGFPTANIAITATKCVPARGVYACWVRAGTTWHRAATNVGYRPTFGGDHLTVEAFLLDFDGDLYDRRVRCAFVARLRDEHHYPTVEALTGQIERDVERARRLLDRHGPPT